MPNTWDEIAHTTFENKTQPIQADATNVAKYGAPSVAVVTAILTGILGAAWKVDPSRPAVLFSAAIIVAAVVLGVYLAFATDIRTRGKVEMSRQNAIAWLAVEANSAGDTAKLKAQLALAAADRDALTSEFAALKVQLAATGAAIRSTADDLTASTAQLALTQARFQATAAEMTVARPPVGKTNANGHEDGDAES